MIIRCEQCSTLYELDEGLLAPDGTQVQCARCQHVFTARRVDAPGEPLPAQAPAAAPAGRAAAPAAASAPVVEPAPSVEAAPTPVAPAPIPAAAGRRPSVYRPPVSQPAQPAVQRSPVLKRDTVGAFESRLRRSHRWKWLAPALIVAVAGAAAGVFLLRARAVDDRARRVHAHALELARADDVRSLEEAGAELDQVIRSAPRLHAARADRALVDLLLAGVLAEGPADKSDASGGRHERARTLVAGATAALAALQKGDLARPEVARALAVGASFGASRPELRRAATAAFGELPGDPWVVAAEASADLRSVDRVQRERAVADLGVAAARHPEALRARYLLARGLLLAGKRTEALAAAEALLLANPRHEGAVALREVLARPIAPGAPVPVAAVAGIAPGAGAGEKAAPLPRKPDSTGGEVSVTPRAETAAAADAPPRPDEVEPAQGEPPPSAAGEASPAAEPAPAPRLRPAAVPEPEPVRGGG